MPERSQTNIINSSAGLSEENKLVALRREKLKAIRGKRPAFPNDFERLHTSIELINVCGQKSAEELKEMAQQTAVAGRIVRMRGPFMVIQDGYGQMQLYMNNKLFNDELTAELKALDLGDIIGAEGEMFKTGKGELTVRIARFRLLTKSLRPLPDKHKGLSDTAMRYRQRYVDLIVNEQSRRIFQVRSNILRYIRSFFDARGFMEVETPMMQLIPGGATARPFITHHNALNQDMFLRVAPELFLKRLTVGGFERVYELNRNFRNEGLSTRHNPEFTMLEFYWAYATYHKLMDLTEELMHSIAIEVLGTSTVSYQGASYDLAIPFRRLSMREAIVDCCKAATAESFATLESVQTLAAQLSIHHEKSWSKGKLIMEIFEQQVEATLNQPTFIYEHPIEVSPLARRNEQNPEVTDRFELYIGGRELANGFSELNDPEDQAARFAAQVQQKEAGDKEAMHYDHDYVTALEYGLPPTAGEGIGIDRLVMLITDAPSIKDVLLFPHLRPQHETG
ncbi:MAG: lysine--tRNA ligase [Gammaproteobacteria bacterium]|nr:lysine--tRNA ligase [Gammaproteobacteria bacterium]